MKALNKLIGRQKERKVFAQLMKAQKSSFVAVYGRRRIGKTYLIKEYFEGRFDFVITGLNGGDKEQQLFNFHTALVSQSSLHFDHQPLHWLEAFQMLIKHLEAKNKEEKKIIFFDELPWFESRGSDFMMALEYFWNSWANYRKDIVLIVCGSAASWMVNMLINNTGGLHNRVTHQMKILPFTLQETEQLLGNMGGQYSKYDIVQLYMVFGGIPYYLDAIDTSLSASQNIQQLIFDNNAKFKNEFFNLYKAVFKKHTVYEQVIEVLSTKWYGMTRTEMVAHQLSSGGTLTKILADLEESGFITSYSSLKPSKKDTIYRLSDYFSLFYFRFIKNKSLVGDDAWIHAIDLPMVKAWQDFTYEQVCLDHIYAIKKYLGISGMVTNQASWHSMNGNQKAQIDLLIDRRDNVINLCECKFSMNEFTIDKSYAERLRHKISQFKEISKTKKTVFLTFITTFGIKTNQYSNMLVQQSMTIDDLFIEF